MKPKNKIRRTHYVNLNKMVWKYFQDCQETGIQLNGKHLKDQAMRYAKCLGLETFRGSEGWLDAFKRRHRIDLRAMTGFPVCYENEELFDESEIKMECITQDGMYPTTSNGAQQNMHMTNFDAEEMTASFLDALERVNSSTKGTPSTMDLVNIIGSQTVSNPLQPSVHQIHQPPPPLPLPNPLFNGKFDENSTILSVVRSCAIWNPNKEVAHAIDVIRSYIMANDPSAMHSFVELQEKLALMESRKPVHPQNTIE